MVRAAEQFEVSEQFVEKDYYVTEILRIVAESLGDKAMFKGGTSLSKGWGLINRFSEDIDLFVNREKFDPPPGTHKMDKMLKELSEAIAQHPALTWLDEGMTIGGFGREDYFQYDSRFDELPGIRPAVRFEPGVQSGTFPTEAVPITSMVGQYLLEQGRSDMADDLRGFEMTLLHFRRTFVEKLFALHGKVVRLIDEDHPSGDTRVTTPTCMRCRTRTKCAPCLRQMSTSRYARTTTRPAAAQNTSRASIVPQRTCPSRTAKHSSRTQNSKHSLRLTTKPSAVCSFQDPAIQPSTKSSRVSRRFATCSRSSCGQCSRARSSSGFVESEPSIELRRRTREHTHAIAAPDRRASLATRRLIREANGSVTGGSISYLGYSLTSIA